MGQFFNADSRIDRDSLQHCTSTVDLVVAALSLMQAGDVGMTCMGIPDMIDAVVTGYVQGVYTTAERPEESDPAIAIGILVAWIRSDLDFLKFMLAKSGAWDDPDEARFADQFIESIANGSGCVNVSDAIGRDMLVPSRGGEPIPGLRLVTDGNRRKGDPSLN